MTAGAQTLTGPRLSELSRCVRQCAYTALGAARDEPPDLSVYFRRGHFFGRLRYEEYAERYGRDQVEREREIPWRFGAGHADIYVRPERRIVEVVSTVTPSPATLGHKIEQVKQYLMLDAEAERASVDVIDPSRLTPVQSLPVHVTDDDCTELAQRIEALGEALAANEAELAPRACTRPSEARGRLCPYASTCFAGWVEQPADLSSLQAEDAYRLVAMRKRELDEARTLAEIRDAAYREALGLAEEAGAPEGRSRAGGVELNRVTVKGRETFALATARKAGAWTAADDERLGPFVRFGEPSTRWSVREVEPA